jgi:hypothetical protein
MKNTLRNSNFGFTKWCLALIAAVITLSGAAQAAVLLEENFNFTGALTLNGWTAASGGGTNPVSAATPSLIYSGLPSSGVGGAASMTTSGEDDRKTFTSQTGDVYASCLVNLSAAQATGDYFFMLSSGTTGFVSRVFAKTNGAGFVLGLSKSTTTAIYDTTTLNFNTTYLIVIKITKNSGSTTDDVSSLWVNPVLGSAESTALLTSTATNDQSTVDSVVIRQGTAANAPTLKIDSILVGTTWADVTPSSPSATGPTISSFSPSSGAVGSSVTISGSNFLSPTVKFNGTTATVTASSATSITATVPNGATTGKITVEVAGQTTATSANDFTVTAPSAPTVTVTPASATGLTSYAGQVSTSTNYTVTGANLGATNLVLTVSTNAIEVSTNSSTGFTNTLSLAPSSGALSNTVYVRMSALAPVGAVSGTVSNVSGSASSDFTVSGTVTAPALTLNLNPTTVAENAGTNASTGTVGIPFSLTNDLTVNLVSSNKAVATVPSTVTITNGQTNATFPIAAVVYNANTNMTVAITASATNYTSASATLTVTDVPTSADLTASGYRQDFSTFTTTQQALPTGWALNGAVVSFMPDPTATSYGVEWGNTNGVVSFPGTGGGLRAQANGGILGYQHTSSTGTLVEVLTLRNSTANIITDLTISYKGRVARAIETRNPIFSVKIDSGTAIGALAYDTLEGDNIAKSAVVSGLSIQPGATFTINWSSARGGTANSSKQIGLSDVSVSIGSNIFAPSVGLVSLNEATLSQTTATINGSVTADGGATISERGFVYSLTSVSANPVIGGSGVTKIVDAAVTVDALNATLTGLAVNSGYTVRAYAINAQGTTYSTALSFTTLQNNPSFTGNYTQDFSTFSSMTSFPTGWRCLSLANVYAGDFLTSGTSSAGFLGGTSGAGVLGYQHTSTSGTLTNKLTLVNGTGGILSTLYVSYQGKVALTSNTRSPAWTVKVNGTTVTDLAYSTANGVDEAKTAQITGLSVAAGESFTISWESDRGTGSGNSRRIGIASVNVSVNAPTPTGSTYTGWLNGVTPSDAAFLDYVFGAATPGTLDASLKPTSTVTGGNLVLNYYVRQNTSGLTVTAKASVDLASGASGWGTTGVTDIAVGGPTTVNGVSVQQRSASVPVSEARKFLRVEAVQQ